MACTDLNFPLEMSVDVFGNGDGSSTVRAVLMDAVGAILATWENSIQSEPVEAGDLDGLVLSYVSGDNTVCDYSGSTVTLGTVAAMGAGDGSGQSLLFFGDPPTP